MLQSFSSSKSAAQPFICSQCQAKFYQKRHLSRTLLPLASSRSQRRFIPREPYLRFGDVHFATSTAQSQISDLQHPLPPLVESSIRERLRKWESENAASYMPPNLDHQDLRKVHSTLNSVCNQSEMVQLEPDETEAADDYVTGFHKDELVDVGDKRSFILPGDLVELRFQGGRDAELAIFIRELGEQGQYYTLTGRWAHRTTSQPKFYVPGFVPRQALEELLPYLPQTDVGKDKEDKLHHFQLSLPRNVGKSLLESMTGFLNHADATYRKAITTLENPHQHLAYAQRYRYATLEEMADILLSKSIARQMDGTYLKAELYAVHRAILLADIGFNIQPRGVLRTGGFYEIIPRDEVHRANNTAAYVRTHVDRKLNGNSEKHTAVEKGPLARFITKCQMLIDESRKNREYTPHGTIGPSSKKADLEGNKHYRKGDPGLAFNKSDEHFINYIISWACMDNFTEGSHFHSAASMILRDMMRYDRAPLDRKTGWTFLQEIGVIPPWETISPFALRLPFASYNLATTSRHNIQGHMEDRLVSIRKDWEDLAVFCVDDIGAEEIDDGISVERTGNPDEHWAHIHVADPAAHFDNVDTDALKFAESMMQNVYLPDRTQAMFDKDFVRSKLSLAPNRPCLTFSARLNSDGDILEHRISAGIVRNVLYITPSTMEELVTGRSSTKIGNTYVVGSSSGSHHKSSRSMTLPKGISEEQKKDLELLHQIGSARAKIMESRGGGGSYDQGMTPQLSVDFDGAGWEKSSSLDTVSCIRYFGDPTIRLFVPRAVSRTYDILSYLMLLAGEVSARWCSARGIPIPYRVTPLNPDSEDPADYYNKVLVPSKGKDGVPPSEVWAHYFRLRGRIQPSIVPGPHLGIGTEMYAKCTSPLRRFPDFIVHSQIEAALLEEAQLGRSLVGNTKEHFLPYSAARLAALLPQIDTRERSIAKQQRVAIRTWISFFMLRAWRFKQATLPETMTFVARKTSSIYNDIDGIIDEFKCSAKCDLPSGLTFDDVQDGDKFEARLTDVDTFEGRIRLEAIRRIEAG